MSGGTEDPCRPTGGAGVGPAGGALDEGNEGDEALVDTVGAVHAFTRRAPDPPLLWARVAAGALVCALLSGALVARSLLWQGGAVASPSVPLRALLSASATLALYAAGRALFGASDTRLLHGSAHWADPVANPAQAGLAPVSLLPALPRGAFLLGTARSSGGGGGGSTAGAPLLCLPAPLARQHGVIIGGTGTGKSRGFFLPNAAFARGASLLCTDPKGELWRHTSGFHPEARRYAPTEPEASAGFNWVPLCEDARYAELCARTLVEATEDGPRRAEAVWIEAETAFLAALFAHAATLPEPTPLTAYRLFAAQKQPDLMAQLAASASEVAREQANIFEQTQERMRGSIVPAVAAKLQFLRDPRVARFTSADLSPPDFGALRRRPQALYWCLQEHDMARLRPLTALFFTVAFEQVARAAPADSPDAVPVRALLDEFANVGTLPQFRTTVSLARSRGLSLWLGLQSISQLEDLYGRASAQTILANCATKVVLPGLDIDSAEYVSRTLGQATVVTERRSWSLRHLFGSTAAVGHHRTEAARPLLTPDEVRRVGRRDALVVTANRPPVLLRRYFYAFAPEPADASALGPARVSSVPTMPTSERHQEPFTASSEENPPPFPSSLNDRDYLQEPSELPGDRSVAQKASKPFRIRLGERAIKHSRGRAKNHTVHPRK